MNKSRLLGAVCACVIGVVFSAPTHADIIQLSGEFVFDAGLYPETFGQDASIKIGSYLILFDPAIATEDLSTDHGTGQSKNYGKAILSASIDYAGVHYSTDSTSSLRNVIAVWDEYASGRDRLSFVIGLGSVSAGWAGIAGDDIIYQGITYRPQNDVSVSPLRTAFTVSLYAEDFRAISSTALPSVSEIETLFSSARSRVEVSSLYGTNGEFRSLGGEITTVNVSVVPIPPALTCLGDTFEPPFSVPITLKNKVKKAIPIKMALVDADGNLITESGNSSPPVVNVSYTLGTGADDSNNSDLVPPGLADEGNEFRFDYPYWIINLATKQFSSAGTYEVTAVAGDDSYIINANSCSGTFARLP